MPPTPPNPKPPADTSKDNTPPWKKRLEIVAVIIALGILVVNSYQTYYAGKSADSAFAAIAQSRDQFRQDQRPYIWLADNPHKEIPNDPLLIKDQVAWSWFYTNYGKSPAHKISLIFTMYIDGMGSVTMRPEINTGPVGLVTLALYRGLE